MIFSTSAGAARPVRMPANSARVWVTALAILSVASSRLTWASSALTITSPHGSSRQPARRLRQVRPTVRAGGADFDATRDPPRPPGPSGRAAPCSRSVDQRADRTALEDGPHVALPHQVEHDDGQVVVHAQGD